ncbi:MAG: 23S rRNA (adenine(1618)-N(6))-methyltransferase RlmF [Pelobium sp.]
MAQKKKKRNSKEKGKLHPRNKHTGRYDLTALAQTCPELSPFVKLNDYGDESIDFANPDAVKMLNKALLMHFYDIQNWDIPEHYLIPPIPGRADYIHHIADVLAKENNGVIPTGKNIKVLDIGVGANCIYPIIGNKEYGWTFIGADIDPLAIESAKEIVDSNPTLKGIKFRLQPNPKHIFTGVMEKTEKFDLSICNPPFHASMTEAKAATQRKLNNLNKEEVNDFIQNFGGKHNELWCQGGEGRFIKDMIFQSEEFSKSCKWFSTLVSKQETLHSAYHYLDQVKAVNVQTISMGQGNKVSRILAWTFDHSEISDTEEAIIA